MFRRLVFTCALLWGSVAFAATTPNSFITPQIPNRGLVQFLQGTDAPSTFKTLYTAGANGSRCYSIWSSNTDPSPHSVYVILVNGGVKYYGYVFTSVVGAGSSPATPAQNVLSGFVGLPVDEYGNSYIQMISGDTLQAQYTTALTAGQFIGLVATCSDF